MVLNNKLLVPVALGLSLVTVTAFVVYYVFKKDDEDVDRPSKVKTSRNVVIEVAIPKTFFPALIGRGGSNIKEIERSSGATIHAKRCNDKENNVCVIRGRAEAAQLAETLIHDFIRNQPVIEEDSMDIPQWACGRIIGHGGANINDISHQSGARVKIENSSENSSIRLVNLKGTAQQIQAAKSLISNCVSQEKCRREMEQCKRSPRHTSSSLTNTSDSSSDTTGDVKNSRKKHVASPQPDSSSSSREVYVSAVSSPARFWVQFVGSQVAQLDDLVEQMTEYYGNKDNRKNHELSEVGIGQVVAAVFRHDGRWYRARVTDIRANEFDLSQKVADVFYLDYGDSEYVATHELCELWVDFLKLRFQAIECFLAGVRPKGPLKDTTAVGAGGQRWDKWQPEAIERFEELTQVARWKPLISKTCSFRKFKTVEGEREREIPGIKLYEVTETGEVDIGACLVADGWAEETPPPPLTHPPLPPTMPFGDLGNSKVLGMLSDRGDRASSLPKDSQNSRMPAPRTSTSLASGLENTERTNPVHLSYPKEPQPHVNGGESTSFLHTERENHESASSETLVPTPSPKLNRSPLEELKANMNRMDSHHNLESLHKHTEH